MCFSIEYSSTFSFLGFFLTMFLLNKNRKYNALVAGYYTSMELLQTFGYLYANNCGYPENFALTIIAHILVMFQPFLWNYQRWGTNSKNKTIFKFSCVLSLVWAFFFTYRLFTGVMGTGITYSNLNLDNINVGEEYCVMNGPTHIMWTLPYKSLNGLEANYFTYLLLWFVPALYEDTDGVLKLLYWIAQILITNIIHELSSIWCLASIPVLVFYFAKCLIKDYVKF
jgi:hypothetical protein